MTEYELDFGLGFGDINQSLFPAKPSFSAELLNNLPPENYPIPGAEDSWVEEPTADALPGSYKERRMTLPRSQEIFQLAHHHRKRFDPRIKTFR